jgi:hypothetical protein
VDENIINGSYILVITNSISNKQVAAICPIENAVVVACTEGAGSV